MSEIRSSMSGCLLLSLLISVCILLSRQSLALLNVSRLSGRSRHLAASMAGFGKQNPSSRSFPPTETAGSKKDKRKKNRAADEISNLQAATAIPVIPSKLSSNNVEKFCPTLNCDYPNIRIRHMDPLILEVDDFFPAALCDEFIERAQSVGEKYASQTFSAATAAMRTSTTWYLQYKHVAEFLQRAQALTGKAVDTFEEPQVVRYELGQQFSWHYDALPPPSRQQQQKGLNGGQRVATLLVYLNDVNSGGATCFKDYDIQIRPVKGKALLFFPCFADGTPDDRTMHAGQVAGETKWISQMWLHQSTYAPAIPPGTSHAEGIAAMEQLNQ